MKFLKVPQEANWKPEYQEDIETNSKESKMTDARVVIQETGQHNWPARMAGLTDSAFYKKCDRFTDLSCLLKNRMEAKREEKIQFQRLRQGEEE